MNDSHCTGAIVPGGIGAATVALLRERGARVAVLDLRTDNAPASRATERTPYAHLAEARHPGV